MSGKPDSTRAKHFFKRPESKIHIKDIESLLVLALKHFCIPLLEIAEHVAPGHHIVILLGSHHIWCYDVSVSQARSEHKHTGLRIKHSLGLYVRRV